jgi:dihydroxyacetone kinase-like protein
VIVNGLGGTPLIELYVMFEAVSAELTRRHLSIARSLVGSFVTSLDMAGVSVTLHEFGPRSLSLWDAPVHAVGLRWGM